MKDEEKALKVVREAEAKAMVPVSSTGTMFFDVAKFEFAQRVARVFSDSTMVPEHFRNNIGNCIIALNYAERTGTDPFMAMQKMYIIHGKPAIETTFAVAMFNASGKFSELEFDMNEEKSSCVAFATKLKTGNVIRGPEVTLKMAVAEGWMSKSGSKWKTLPEMMLMYRSAIFFIRQYAPEVLLGMLSREEVYDIEGSGSPGKVKGRIESDFGKDELVSDETPPPDPPAKAPAKKKKKAPAKKKKVDQKASNPMQEAKVEFAKLDTVLKCNKWRFEREEFIDNLPAYKRKELVEFLDEHTEFVKGAQEKEGE